MDDKWRLEHMKAEAGDAEVGEEIEASKSENAFDILKDPRYKYGYTHMQWMQAHNILVDKRTRKDLPYHVRYKMLWDIADDIFRNYKVTCLPLDDLVFIHTRAEHLLGSCNYGVIRENNVIEKWADYANGRKVCKCVLHNVLLATPLDESRKGEVIAAIGQLLTRGQTLEDLTAEKKAIRRYTHATISSGLFNKKSRNSAMYSTNTINTLVTYLFQRDQKLGSPDYYVRWILNYLCGSTADIFLPTGAKKFEVAVAAGNKCGVITKVDTRALLSEMRLLTTVATAEEMLCDKKVRSSIENIYVGAGLFGGISESVVDHIVAKRDQFDWVNTK